MTMIFKSEILAKRLEELTFEQQLVFAASCCQRLMKIYDHFISEVSTEVNELREIMSTIWCHIEKRQFINSLKDLINKTYRLIPDSEEYDSDLTGHAQHACISVYYLLKVMDNSDSKEKIVNIAELIIDSVDWIVQDDFEAKDTNEIITEDLIQNHILMQKEISQQEHDLNVLENKALGMREQTDMIKKSSEKSQLNLVKV